MNEIELHIIYVEISIINKEDKLVDFLLSFIKILHVPDISYIRWQITRLQSNKNKLSFFVKQKNVKDKLNKFQIFSN